MSEKPTVIKTFHRERETKNMIRFQEEETPGMLPVVGTLYIHKQIARQFTSVQVTMAFSKDQ